MAFTKPNVNTPWAETGEIISPSGSKVAQGWIEEIPDFEFENWIQNRSDQFNAHVNQYGITVWDAVTQYITDKSYVQASNGVVYRAATTNTNKNPLTNSSDWSRAFNDPATIYTKTESDTKYATRANNLSDLANAATARTNLSVYSKSETDTSYAKRSNNLSDLQSSSNARSNIDVYSTGESDSRYLNKLSDLSDLHSNSIARSNLDVYSKGESNGTYLNESNNLSDLPNASTARSNLGVYSTGESDGRYLNESSNLSDLHSNSTARSNLYVYSKSDVYTKTQADSRYVGKSGDTMTGKLTLDSDPTSALHAATKQYADAGGMPPGSVTAFAGNSPPIGYLKCNGDLVSGSTFPDLFSAIGTTYGSGYYSTNFRVPDLRGEFVRGWDDSRGVDSGRAFGSFQTGEFAEHVHSVEVGTTDGSNDGRLSSGDDYTKNVQWQNDTKYAGGADETRPRNIALLYIIKT